MIVRGELDNHELTGGDTVVMASVGAGMNINSVVYRFP
jgi:3-oxoacyl-[acyl-carrier-protein] synthase-3